MGDIFTKMIENLFKGNNTSLKEIAETKWT